MPKPQSAPAMATRLTGGDNHLDPEYKISPLRQLKRIQRVLYSAAMAPGVDNREVAALALAWERLEERKRVMLMKPAPKPIDVASRKRSKAPVAPDWTDPTAGTPGNAPESGSEPPQAAASA